MDLPTKAAVLSEGDRMTSIVEGLRQYKLEDHSRRKHENHY
jgi:hypothetical protein